MAPFPGTARREAVAFSINGIGYVGFGRTGVGAPPFNDLYAYDPVVNSWTLKAPLPAGGPARSAPSAFVLNGMGYICGGNPNYTPYLKDLWQYDPSTNTWQQKASLPATAAGRSGPIAFSAYCLGYVGAGNDNQSPNYASNDFYSYNPATDSWTQRANIPGERRASTSFVVNGVPYAGGGWDGTSYFNDMYTYNANDTWTSIPNYGGTAAYTPVAFTIAGTGYMGTGGIGSGTTSQIWSYTPCVPSSETIQWGASASVDIGHSALSHSLGSRYVVGHSQNGSSIDIQLTKMAHNGTLIWSKDYDLEGDDGGTSLNIVEGHGKSLFISGQCNGLNSSISHAIIMKLDTFGTVVWTKRFLPTNGQSLARSVLETASGDVYLCGSTTTPTAGSSDGFFGHLTSTGALVWLNVVGQTGNQHLTDIDELADGSFLICGQSSHFDGITQYGGWYIHCNASGSILSMNQYYATTGDGAFIRQLKNQDGTILYTGLTDAYSGTGTYAIMAQFANSSGAYTQVKIFGTAQTSYRGINAVQMDQGWLISGMDMGSNRLVLLRLDDDGGLMWAASPHDISGAFNTVFGEPLAIAPDGSLMLVGSTYANDPNGDIQVLLTNACGEFVCPLDTIPMFEKNVTPDTASIKSYKETKSDVIVSLNPVVTDKTEQVASQWKVDSCGPDPLPCLQYKTVHIAPTQMGTVTPNPTSDMAYITLPDVEDSPTTVNVIDSKGGVTAVQAVPAGESMYQLDFRSYASGIYLIHWIDPKGSHSYSTRVVVQH
jgi:N-acetylneuraminic acid mutarotase